MKGGQVDPPTPTPPPATRHPLPQKTTLKKPSFSRVQSILYFMIKVSEYHPLKIFPCTYFLLNLIL